MPISIITVGHVLNELRKLPGEIVHCCVTSPPYYGLRSYGTEPQVWGGDPNCRHEWGAEGKSEQRLRNGIGSDTAKVAFGETLHPSTGAFCCCGAWRGDLGLEPTPELFIQHLVEVFREVSRVLRKDGTLWLNIGDSYASNGGAYRHNNGNKDSRARHDDRAPARPRPFDAKPKDLLMIPAQLALALRADGWYLRSEIVWAKKAPMPESCTDRPTCAHEKVFLLTKSARYFYDAEAVKEVTESDHPAGNKNGFIGRQGGAEFHVKSGGIGNPVAWSDVGGKRNMRNVWHLGPEPFPEAHFATFVSEIPRRAILAGTSAKGVCPKCGGPWVRQTSSTLYSSTYGDSRRPDSPGSNDQKGSGNQFGTRAFAERMRKEVETIGWRPSCSCANIDSSGEALVPTLRHPLDQLKYRDTPIPATVLDPFLGSGTAAMVADRLGRHCIGIELSPQYAEIAERRCRKDAGLFAEILTG